MNPTLRGFLAVVFVAAGGLAVFTYRDQSVTFADVADAGIGPDCNPRIVTCLERLNPALRNKLADSGYVAGPKAYARIIRQAYRCPSTDGGKSELIVPGFVRWADADLDTNVLPAPSQCADSLCTTVPGFCGQGPKRVGLAVDPSGWVRAPLDGGTDCLRDADGDGGRWFGTGNVFPSAQAVGGNCEAVSGGTVIAGDDPDTSL